MQYPTPTPPGQAVGSDFYNLTKGNHPVHFLFGLYLPVIALCSLIHSFDAPYWTVLAQFAWLIMGGCLILLLGIAPKEIKLSSFFKGLFVYGTLFAWPVWIYHFRRRISLK
ncbi:hypothetical protein FT643_18505 [Ketobacter sp. MCCC 1A13808]|uniref:hypothetical protein n=1 Tax=Ketobacter sp. MCCC 1A13808 TaxID=2602738 RepID=UPI000F157E5A|nr:hypothetical protein [Ketobacter sp. MCCC 1A13808]MVF14133.1 hypothetical protein [Ketobacter sp. MCCC 1A13808]RLP55156.1 MAG: hypothetical protein D6160_07970 [Ketobacter sp.]